MSKLTTTDLNEYRLIPNLLANKRERLDYLIRQKQNLEEQIKTNEQAIIDTKDDIANYQKRRQQLKRRGAY